MAYPMRASGTNDAAASGHGAAANRPNRTMRRARTTPLHLLQRARLDPFQPRLPAYPPAPPGDHSGSQWHRLAWPPGFTREWIHRNAARIAASSDPIKMIASFRAAGRFEMTVVDAFRFKLMRGWGNLTLYRAVERKSFVEASLRYVSGGRFVKGQWVPGAPVDRDTWYGVMAAFGLGLYFTVSRSLEYSLRVFSGELLQGGDGWVLQAKIRKDASVITEEEIKRLPNLDKIPGFPRVLWHYADDPAMKALYYDYDAIYVRSGQPDEQLVILNKRIMVVNRQSVPAPETEEHLHERIADAIRKQEDRKAEIEAALRLALVKLRDLKKEEAGADIRQGHRRADSSRKILNEIKREIWRIKNADTIQAVKTYFFAME